MSNWVTPLHDDVTATDGKTVSDDLVEIIDKENQRSCENLVFVMYRDTGDDTINLSDQEHPNE